MCALFSFLFLFSLSLPLQEAGEAADECGLTRRGKILHRPPPSRPPTLSRVFLLSMPLPFISDVVALVVVEGVHQGGPRGSVHHVRVCCTFAPQWRALSYLTAAQNPDPEQHFDLWGPRHATKWRLRGRLRTAWDDAGPEMLVGGRVSPSKDRGAYATD